MEVDAELKKRKLTEQLAMAVATPSRAKGNKPGGKSKGKGKGRKGQSQQEDRQEI